MQCKNNKVRSTQQPFHVFIEKSSKSSSEGRVLEQHRFNPGGLLLGGVSAQLCPASAGRTQPSWPHKTPTGSSQRPEGQGATALTGSTQSESTRGDGSVQPGDRPASSNKHLQIQNHLSQSPLNMSGYKVSPLSLKMIRFKMH